MPTGKAIKLERFSNEELKTPLQLVAPEGAHRAYLHAEVGFIRYLFTDDGRELETGEGFPLLPDYPDEFDAELHRLWVVAGNSDALLNCYWYGT
jgi:hypothetical protein